MCESNAYVVDKDGNEKLLMENVDYLKSDGGRLLLRSIFGEETSLDGQVREMKLTAHKILVEAS
ncbi:CooT family nickel-binding protein [Thermodesulfobacteriota bacterium]